MDEATQQATQEVLDPRRLGGTSSGLNQNDVADVLAILHPVSAMAIKIVEKTASINSQHVLFRNPFGTFGSGFDIDEQETIILNQSDPFNATARAGDEIALRMSSNLIDPRRGFVFGRNPQSSDIVIPPDAGRRISNQHFRIYLNKDCVLMIQDTSTNGTLVDNNLLKRGIDGLNTSRMLQQGSIICIHNSTDTEMIKFIVTFPPRASHFERYAEKLRAFLARCLVDPQSSYGLNSGVHQATMKWDGGETYNIIGQLGQGAFATVHQIATKMDGKVLAAKELEKRRFMKNGQLDKKLDNEMKIMRSLRHPNIVEFKEYVDQGDYMYIIMEFVRHGDLQQYLKRNRRLEESQARAMAQQILSALSYLHRSNITHRDIKPDNILISEVEPFTVKLSDFGLSKVVQHQETFLKTFCGTLLYCAPEVFPFYEKTKGTKRTRGAKQGFHSYSSSVDIWSFAGVLWYSLCGSPPFEGVADQTGQAMFNNIMTTKVDPSPLRQANVSEQCIDLLCKMLQTDPALRPTDAQCLSHPWLREGAMIPPEVGLHSIVEEDEEEVAKEQLSQLSIHEEDASDDEAEGVLDDEEFGRLISNRAPKRVRTDCRFPRNQLRDKDDLSSAEVSYDREALRAITGSHIIRDSFLHDNPHSGRPRLFGEIGRSALESSGILNARADGTLSHAGSDGQILPDDALPCNVTPTRKALDRSQVTPLSSEHNAQPDSSFSSPSLLGAESLVRELNMASPQSPGSGVQSPNEPATPKTPEVHQHSSLGDTSQSQFSDATPKAKPPALNRQITLPNRPSRQISLPKTASFYYDPFDPSTHNLEYASKVSGIDFVSGSEKSASTETESDAQKSQDQLVTQSAVPSLSMELGIKPPPRRLGKLTTTPDSFIPHFSLMIDQARTSWGRHPDATVVYGDPFDTRIPKLAFVIIWYRRNANSPTVQELSQQGKDWTTVDDLHAAIFTAASSGISINGKLLRKADDKGRPLYGNIHTGDIIQVFQDARTSECLKFKCEFYHSAAKEPRPPGQSFHIRAGNKNML